MYVKLRFNSYIKITLGNPELAGQQSALGGQPNIATTSAPVKSKILDIDVFNLAMDMTSHPLLT